MASISKVVRISVSLLTAGIKEAGFGIPLIADYHTRFSERVRFYADAEEMADDGFVEGDAALAAASAIFAQQPRVERVAIGRRALSPSLKTDLYVTLLTTPKAYTVNATLPSGAVEAATYQATTDKLLSYDAQSANFVVGSLVTGGTSGATGTIVADTDAGTTGTLRLSGVTGTFANDEALTSTPSGGVATVNGTASNYETVATIVTGLASAIDALAGIAAAGVTSTYVSVTPTTAGQWFGIEVVEDGSAAGFEGLRAAQSHADPGIATDLAAIKAQDDSWYGVTLTSCGAAEIAAASSWTESAGKQFIQNTQDGAILAGTAGNVMLVCQAANRDRTGLIWHQNPAEHAGAAWMGSVFPIDPGAVTYAFRQLRNVTKSILSTTQMTEIEDAGGNYFVDIGGVGVTFGEDGGGKASGGEWLDIIRDLDWYEVQIGVEHLGVKLANNKVPMTNAGIAMEENALRTATARACTAGFLDASSVVFTVPDVLEIPTNKRAARTLDKLKVTARVQGAIHITEVVATITN